MNYFVSEDVFHTRVGDVPGFVSACGWSYESILVDWADEYEPDAWAPCAACRPDRPSSGQASSARSFKDALPEPDARYSHRLLGCLPSSANGKRFAKRRAGWLDQVIAELHIGSSDELWDRPTQDFLQSLLELERSELAVAAAMRIAQALTPTDHGARAIAAFGDARIDASELRAFFDAKVRSRYIAKLDKRSAIAPRPKSSTPKAAATTNARESSEAESRADQQKAYEREASNRERFPRPISRLY